MTTYTLKLHFFFFVVQHVAITMYEKKAGLCVCVTKQSAFILKVLYVCEVILIDFVLIALCVCSVWFLNGQHMCHEIPWFCDRCITKYHDFMINVSQTHCISWQMYHEIIAFCDIYITESMYIVTHLSQNTMIFRDYSYFAYQWNMSQNY